MLSQTLLGVEGGRRFVQKDDLRVVEQGGGQGHPLLLPARKSADARFGLVFQVELFQKTLDRFGPAVERGQHFQVLADAQFFKEGAGLELQTDAVMQFVALAAVLYVQAVYRNGRVGTGVGSAQPFNNFQRGRFPGPVRPQNPENLAFQHRETHSVHRFFARISAMQIPYLDGGVLGVGFDRRLHL